MILVDTSVLISFLKGIENEQVKKLEEIIQNNIPFGINNFIYQELLQGTKTENEFNSIKEYLGTQKFYNLKYGIKSYENAAKLYFKCKKKGITIRSTIDLLIAQTAIENNLYLLHDDKDFSLIAQVDERLKEY
ncbi:PilT protein domain-containing protein [Thermoanaerobacter kivui]|uniref:PilT protein domain-containing protein n=1 Tax=Thermoanaerobacter kivui TaxID=2325 RepID=A0A097AU46_THEKI|nr:PIN domain nuclease [Thermoanaerobacter kivui]AIS53339.1 PilT protein domain-containing protein [Thermoanaerobacter kivui]